MATPGEALMQLKKVLDVELNLDKSVCFNCGKEGYSDW